MLKLNSRIVVKEAAAMATILTMVLTACIAALVTRLMMPTPKPPTVIYIQAEPQQEQGGIGCLPIVVVTLGSVLLIRILAG
ncbi:hypothetical protein SE17_19020 [Kouleothrix aurantiaca]|uniref:Uncharacterized protein n=1 Tax=Kouleothrix aurantiaca TaxID=186479 RepID=A0A0P9DFA7_9CHLR|nr:hypothetical protein SE17_19020 [Kouleothrix aurantiaca]